MTTSTATKAPPPAPGPSADPAPTPTPTAASDFRRKREALAPTLTATAPSPRKERRKLRKVVPEWALPLVKSARYKGAKGGRGGGKSHEVIELQLMFSVKNPHRRVVFLREVQKSLKDSVKHLLEQKIKDMGIEDYFDIRTTEIRCAKGDGVFLFQGLAEHTAVTIKSLEGIDCAVIEEAQVISQRSLDLLLPTIRKEGSEVWAIWNPLNPTDPIDRFFAGLTAEDDFVLVHVNYRQNRHASEALIKEAERCKRLDPIKYKHVYGGGYEEHSDARIFKHIRIESFETPSDLISIGGLRFGCDWGFSVDPLVLLRGFVIGRTLYIEYEAHEIGVEIEDTKAHFLTVPGSTKWTITAGKDRPERIKSAQRQGFKIKPAIGGNNSVIEGVEYLQNFEIVIHTRCAHAQDAFLNYKHPIDKMTEQILPVLPKGKDHVIEAARYMVEDIRRFEEGKPKRKPSAPPPPVRHHWRR